MEDQVGGLETMHALVGQLPGAARQMRVGDDGDERQFKP